MLAQLGKGERDTMRDLSDMGIRVIVAILVGAGLVALAGGVSQLLPPGGLPDSLGGWPLLAALAALLCGVCALAMSLALRWPTRRLALRIVVAGLVVSALAWGAILAAATKPAWWAQAVGWQWVAKARPALMTVGSAIPAWLLLFAALAGLLAGLRHSTSATRRALTPLWLAPLWGGSVGVVFGLLYAAVFSPLPCRSLHCYGLDPSPWTGLLSGVPLGAGAGLIVGLALALSLRLALALRPADLVAAHVAARSTDA